jgi:manganese/zinc/iron transport system permease protein
MTADGVWIVAIGGLTAATCAWVGTFLMLRRLTPLGDAVAHSALPGVVAAFLLAGGRGGMTMYLGATIAGLAATALIEFLRSRGGMKPDAAVGVVFTGFFAAGVALLTATAEDVDLDVECVLYGEIAYAPLNVWVWGGQSWGPRAFWQATFGFVFVVAAIVLMYKELTVVAFDEAFAQSVGMSPGLWRYILMGLTAVAVVSAFESVGAVLVTAFLSALPGAAYLLTGRLTTLLVLATAFGWLAAAGGYALAVWLDGSIAGGMASVAGTIFFFSWAVARRRK